MDTPFPSIGIGLVAVDQTVCLRMEIRLKNWPCQAFQVTQGPQN